ncbi:MAG: RagB/SusD family nutrient uptake outer membrane protein [Bacteroidota bacterium]
MKKLFFLFLLALIGFGFQACTDLEENPIGLLAPQSFFNTADDLETAMLGTYAWLANEQMYGRKMVLTLQLRSDMCDIGDRNTPSRRQDVNDFNMDSNNGMVTAIWPNAYRAISAANAAVDGAAQLEETGARVDAIVAEARFLRAFVYYHLVRQFGDLPYIDFFIADPASVSDLSKTSASEVYVNIIADMEFAKANLPDVQANGVRTRPTRGTATAYLASVHMTLGNWQESYDNAKEVIDNQATFGYELEADFATLFNARVADNLQEHIFAVDFLGNQNGGSNQNTDWMGPITGIRSVTVDGDPSGSGWSVSVPNFRVYETWDDRDYRKEVSFIDTAFMDGQLVGFEAFAPNHGSPRPHIGKFFRLCGESRGDCGRSDNNYVAMRYAEILLIAAEAGNMIGRPADEIFGYVNQVRARARNWPNAVSDFPADVSGSLSQGEITDLILEERRLELAFEFKRWYDIKRYQLGDEVFKGPNSLEPHDNFNSSRDYLLPLPQDELDRNPNLAPQNSGY